MPMRLLLISLFLSASLGAQTDVLVRWAPGKTVSKWAGAQVQTLAESSRVQLLRFPDATTAAAALKALRQRPDVLAASLDQPVDFRRDPRDPNYPAEQENLRRAGFDRAWELTTGGRTAAGREIVVAVLDDGFDVSHPDLRDNLWTNAAEIPGDLVDNDGNGFIDDRHGWNFNGDRPTFGNAVHGTQVTGVLGARGNNELGGSGTNWDLQLMLFSIRSVSDIVGAYAYVLDQRRRYAETGGREGAYVVATNASFGIEGADCGDFPVWASMYEDLGRAGILTAGSTANRSWDVDLRGDMPTTCTSDFIIGVTNVGPDDRLWTSAAYGQRSIDLAAPGEGSWTTRPGGTYGTFGSTSAAAPYVTGAIALLHATPLPALEELTERDPAAAALLIRRALLEGVDRRVGLAGEIATGGTLNVAESQRLLARSLAAEVGEGLAITEVRPNPATDGVTVFTNALVLNPELEVSLTDRMGRQWPLRWAPAGAGNLSLRFAGLPGGWYLITLSNGERVARHPLIVR